MAWRKILTEDDELLWSTPFQMLGPGMSVPVGEDLVFFSGGSGSVFLPDAATVPGERYRVKMLDPPPAVCSVGSLGGMVDGMPSLDLNDQNAAAEFVSDGTDWWVFSGHRT